MKVEFMHYKLRREYDKIEYEWASLYSNFERYCTLYLSVFNYYYMYIILADKTQEWPSDSMLDNSPTGQLAGELRFYTAIT